MKTRLSRHQSAKVSHSRWLAYATATAATTLAGSHSLEAAIHYSGVLDKVFPPDKDISRKFPLDQRGDSLIFEHTNFCPKAAFSINGIVSASFRGYAACRPGYVEKLSFGQNISSGEFVHLSPSYFGIMAEKTCGCSSEHGPWELGGTGFVGFRFNNGAGIQYGWARVKLYSTFGYGFRVLDYAYADPGEPIRTGQKSVGEMVTDQGSLGWLALGAVGLLVWRRRRSRPAGSSSRYQ